MVNILASILIPTRNRAKYLKYTIESALCIRQVNIEIIVSENHGDDNGLEIAGGYTDPRLKVIQPPQPLPMHLHWEFLLSHAKGRWITFLGDDDLIFPYACDILRSIDSYFTNIEVICSARAYLIWPGSYGINHGKIHAKASPSMQIEDSKLELSAAVKCIHHYIDLPQIYSGGFQRQSLIDRVKKAQGGRYFLSAVPDAYSCVMGLAFTYRYLRLNIPLCWVGTSPSSDGIHNSRLTKNRTTDYYDMLQNTGENLSESFGNQYNAWTFYVHFLEAWSSSCIDILRATSYVRIKLVVLRSIIFLLKKDKIHHAKVLADSFGIQYPSLWNRILVRAHIRLDKLILNWFRYFSPARKENHSLRLAQSEKEFVFDHQFSASPSELLKDINHQLYQMSSTLISRMEVNKRTIHPCIKFPPWDPRSSQS